MHNLEEIGEMGVWEDKSNNEINRLSSKTVRRN